MGSSMNAERVEVVVVGAGMQDRLCLNPSTDFWYRLEWLDIGKDISRFQTVGRPRYSG
jgi:hypothetical protein